MGSSSETGFAKSGHSAAVVMAVIAVLGFLGLGYRNVSGAGSNASAESEAEAGTMQAASSVGLQMETTLNSTQPPTTKILADPPATSTAPEGPTTAKISNLEVTEYDNDCYGNGGYGPDKWHTSDSIEISGQKHEAHTCSFSETFVNELDAWLDIRLDGKYRKLQVSFAIDEGTNLYDEYSSAEVVAEVQILDAIGDSQNLLAEGQVEFGAPQQFEVDVTGMSRVRFRYYPTKIDGSSRMAILSVYDIEATA